MSDVFVEDVEMQRIRFVPMIRFANTKVAYKEFYIEFESLPIELQAQIKQIAFERVSAQLEREAQQHEQANTASTRRGAGAALESKNPVIPRG